MDVEGLAALLEPAAVLGAVVTLLAALAVLWRYRGAKQASLKRYLRNWRLRQTLGVSALFYLALTASCAILHDRWGWLYLMIGLRLGIWWYQLRFDRNLSLARSLWRSNPPV